MSYLKYSEIIQERESQGEIVTYQDMLNSIEWQEKRLEIIKRDRSQCKICNEPFIHEKYGIFRNRTKKESDEYIKSIQKRAIETDTLKNKYSMDNLPYFLINIHVTKIQVILHVHHTYYIVGKLPWEYPNEALMTLCNQCHQEFHDSNTVPVYLNGDMLAKVDVVYCSKCNGSGYRPEYHYYQNGICFGCNGVRYLMADKI